MADAGKQENRVMLATGQGMKRLFFALWPEQAVRSQCHAVQKNIRVAGLQLVPADNLHITLLFLGNIDSKQQAAIIEAAAMLTAPYLTFTFDQLSYWKKPAVLCLTTLQFDNRASILAEQLSAIAEQNSVSVDKRPFQPHVTLARKVKQPANLDFAPIVWQAMEFCLVESLTAAKGAEYRVIYRWKLKSPDLDEDCIF